MGQYVIKAENEKKGTIDWQLTCVVPREFVRWDLPVDSGIRQVTIEGYVSRSSVKAGDTLDFKVSTSIPAGFFLDIYRLGYYGGKGARRVTRIKPSSGAEFFNGEPQDPEFPIPPTPEKWSSCCSFTIPSDWVSGVYLGKLSLIRNTPEKIAQSYVIFIVREPNDRQADFLFQCNDYTWQAYNYWPGTSEISDPTIPPILGWPGDGSLYQSTDGKWSPWPWAGPVGFDRPYAYKLAPNEEMLNPLGVGTGPHFMQLEFPLLYWMEREGYEVIYCAASDLDANASILTRVKAFLCAGHSEYWSLQQYQNVLAAVENGLHAAFFSGNSASAAIVFQDVLKRRFSRGGRFCKNADVFGIIHTPETDFPLYDTLATTTQRALVGAETMLNPYAGTGDWILPDPIPDQIAWIFENTGMQPGDSIPGLVGFEFHGDPLSDGEVFVVATGQVYSIERMAYANYKSTIRTVQPKGNLVFNAATNFWTQGLSCPPGHIPAFSYEGRPQGPDSRVQQMTRNILNKMGG